ncbi:SPOR domain-containing protein [Aliiroseovarius sp. F20344]|uniref:SPOR domain-containing protein n=1 Tax=Aliiroseovarius sp. F20344 TaxID=2926414 RepID=UPI001FF2D81D|nr:SPOR domain-containing protein [Aliiroseovarius sp. F20344]MCK0143303.1 SPOR domain-containing protein [Aliiroseovarius sp. F20344]
MAEMNWGQGTPHPAYQNHPDYDHATRPVATPAVGSAYVHPAHGGPAPHVPHDQTDQYGYVQDPAYAAPAGPASANVRGGILVNYAGAAVSLALIVGLGVWGYKLAMRDVTGIPVVRALEGPMRVQPVNPGGQSADHQGLAVNAVQAEGEASAPADRLVLAPEPASLSIEEDLGAEVARSDTDVTVPAAAIQAYVAAPGADTDPVAAALAIAEQVAANAPVLGGDTPAQPTEVVASLAATPVPAPSVVEETVAAAVPSVKIIPASVPGVSKSLRPAVRPSDLNTKVAAAPAPSTATAATKEVDPATLAAGTRLVQLGAFDSAEVAREQWDALASRFEDYMGGKARVIEKAQTGGKTFYRLRAMGFADLADARRFCSVLMASKAACIPVATR